MIKSQSFSCDLEKWQKLGVIAEKLGVSRNKLIQMAVENILKTGEIESSQTYKSIDALLKEEQLSKAKNKNKLFEIEKRKIEATTKIIEYHAKHLDVIGATPSRAAKTAMEHQVMQTQPYDENAVYCPDCKWHSNSRDSISYQIDRITDHVRYHHKRNFTEDEAKIISELLI